MSSLQAVLDRLVKDNPPRVWSLLVTIFGVLGQSPGAEISGTVLNRIMMIIGIKPEATRVALHRLKKDGWIAIRKDGRKSHYRLSTFGQEQAALASPRIYHHVPLPEVAWLVILPRHADLAPDHLNHSIAIAPNVWITTKEGIGPDMFGTPITPDTVMPDWVMDKLFQPSILAQCGVLLAQLEEITASLDDMSDLPPFARIVLITLVVHSWRRIVLRVPVLPDPLNARANGLIACRTQVLDMIAGITLPTIRDLEQAAIEAPV